MQNETPTLALGASASSRPAPRNDSHRVSVVIPTFNRAHLIGKALDSVFVQTCRADQVIVVDDGSIDGTENILAPLTDRIIYRRIPHSGASIARNVGIDIASGQYIAFLDSDDVWESRFLERMTTALGSAPNASFAYCDYATFDARGMGQTAHLAANEKANGDIFAGLLKTDFISTGTLLIRRECFEQVGQFDPILTVAHDWDMWLRLARVFNARYVDEPLVRIRTDPNGLTRNTVLLHADNLRILSRWRHEVKDDRQLELIRRNASANHRALWLDSWHRREAFPIFKHLVMMWLNRFV